jgi:hypothetical protein
VWRLRLFLLGHLTIFARPPGNFCSASLQFLLGLLAAFALAPHTFLLCLLGIFARPPCKVLLARPPYKFLLCALPPYKFLLGQLKRWEVAKRSPV